VLAVLQGRGLLSAAVLLDALGLGAMPVYLIDSRDEPHMAAFLRFCRARPHLFELSRGQLGPVVAPAAGKC